MDFAATRFAFGLLVLLASVIVGSWNGKKVPSREVVELVSVTYKSARPEAVAAIQRMDATAQAGAQESAPPTALVVQADVDDVELAGPAVQRPDAMRVAQQAKAVPRAIPAAGRTARSPLHATAAVKSSCRSKACGGAASAAKIAAKRAGTHGRGAEPPLPAIFVPIRTLGFYLQAKLGTRPDAKAESKKRKR